MPELNWIGKNKVVNHDKELPFRVLRPVKELSAGENNENLLIQGDNLEALKSLMPLYYEKIKCIFIDPPYNTGNEAWIYNDKVNSSQIKSWLNKVVGAEGEDLCRHDKWLCMIYPRIKLLRDLLTNDGAIFVAIDDNELNNLRLIMNEVFGERNYLATITWQHSIQPKGYTNKFSLHHNYLLAFRKSEDFELKVLKRTDEDNKSYSNPDNDPKGPWRTGDVRNALYRPNLIFDVITPSGKIIKPPSNGWRWSKKTMEEKISAGEVIFSKDETRIIKKIYLSTVNGRAPESIWFGKDVGTTREAMKEIKDIFSGDSPFQTPKPTRLIKRIIQLVADKDSIILDSFAGSGTTGQAVLEMNKEDGGNRKFILVELEKEISENVTVKRLKKVINGYRGAKFENGTGQGFKYLDLNGELYDYSGFVNPDAKYEDMAAYIFFTETKKYLDISTIGKPYIGSHAGNHYFLFFNGTGNSIFNEETLNQVVKSDGNKVIYADKCLLDEEELLNKSIVFKQIPYQLIKY